MGSDLSSSTIHVYFDTSDVRSILGGKESYSGCNFLRPAEALHRHLLRPFVAWIADRSRSSGWPGHLRSLATFVLAFGSGTSAGAKVHCSQD